VKNTVALTSKILITGILLRDPALHARKLRKKKREDEKHTNRTKGRKKNSTEVFHSFFQAIVSFLKEIWKDRCIDRNTPVVGGRIVAKYDALTKKVTY
jgi:hypothetical protein